MRTTLNGYAYVSLAHQNVKWLPSPFNGEADMSLSMDYSYSSEIKSFMIEKDARQEIRDKSRLKGKVSIRVTSNNTVTVQIAGPHTELTEVKGIREFSFNIEPETDFIISIQTPAGFFSKSAEVTVQIEKKGSKRALAVLEQINNLTTMLRENPAFYELQKETVTRVLAGVTEVWGHYGDEAKGMVNELISTTKKLESETG